VIGNITALHAAGRNQTIAVKQDPAYLPKRMSVKLTPDQNLAEAKQNLEIFTNRCLSK